MNETTLTDIRNVIDLDKVTFIFRGQHINGQRLAKLLGIDSQTPTISQHDHQIETDAPAPANAMKRMTST
jgi:hypothetical protein